MKNLNKILKIFLLIVGLAVITLTSGRIFDYEIFEDENSPQNQPVVLNNQTAFFPELIEDFSYYEYDSIQDCYYIYNSDNKLDCYLLLTLPYCEEIEGFGGNVPFAIIFNPNDEIRELYLLEHSETSSWIEGLNDEKFFESWNGLTAEEAMDAEIDAISGATFTSDAVIQSMDLRLSKFSSTSVKEKGAAWLNILGMVSSFLFLVFALFSFLVPKQAGRFRIFLLLSSVGILGFWQGDFLSIALFNNWLLNGMNIWAQIFLFVVLVLSVLLPIITNKDFYCQYVCPFGAAQELVGKLNKRKIVLNQGIVKILKYFRYVYLIIIGVLIVAAADVSLENFEPFSAFKFQFASITVLILALVLLFIAIFVNKPGCRFFCPTGALLGLFRAKPGKSKKEINYSLVLNVLLVVAVFFFIYLNFIQPKNTNETNGGNETIIQNNALEIIHNRKSVRHYTDQEVTKEQLEVLVKAGMAAPSARNLQVWEFIVVQDKEVLKALASDLPYAKMLESAQAAIIVCGDIDKAITDVDSAYWVQDCSAATQNILLAAESEGLGAVWTSAYPYQEIMQVVVENLDLPDNIIPLNVIPIGYPTGEDKPKDKWKPEKLHWNKW